MAPVVRKRRKNTTIAKYKRFFAVKAYQAKRSPKRAREWLRLTFVTPWLLAWKWIRGDWKVLLPTFIGVLIAVSASVWGFYLAAAIAGLDTDTGKWLLGIGSAVWTWWLIGPASPFLGICLGLTAGIYAIIKKIKGRKKK